MTATLLTLAALVLLAAGAAGTVYPALPGLPLMFLGAWLLAYGGGYEIIGALTLTVLGVLAAAGFAADFTAGLLGAKYTGASRQALWGAFFGSIAGMFAGLPGLIFGPLFGAAAGEFLARRNLLAAGKVGIGTFIGFIVGTAAKIGAALAITAVLLFRYLAYWLA